MLTNDKHNANIDTIHYPNVTLVNEPEDIRELDAIFSWEKCVRDIDFFRKGYNGNDPYLNPNYQLYYFANIKREINSNQHFHVVHHNNIAIPINDELKSPEINTLSNLLKQKFVKGESNVTVEGLAEGVYVVECFKITKSCNDANVLSYDHLLNSDSVLSEDQDLQAVIRNSVSGIMANKLARYKSLNEFTARFVYFIPKDRILSVDGCYISPLNILITSKFGKKEIIHPKSHYAKNKRIITSTIKPDLSLSTFIEYKIILNTVPSETEHSKYYVKIGNEVKTINILVDPEIKEGVYVSYYTNGMSSSNGYCELKDAGEKLGIYPTYDEAATKGDISKVLEENKYKLEANKIEKERSSLELKYKYDLDKMEHEMESLKFKHEHEITKANSELSSLKAKHEHEITKMEKEAIALELKHSHELEKMKHDMDKMQKEMVAMETKHKHDNVKMESEYAILKEKLRREIEKALIEKDVLKSKLDLEIKRSKTESTKATIGLIGTLVGAALTAGSWWYNRNTK